MGMGTIQRLLVVPATCLIVVTGAAATAAAAQDPLGAAKDLYASAAYEEALSALTSAKEHGAPEVVRQADQYVAFCLLALGRKSEAEAAAESAIREDPLAPLDPRDASPRIEALFAAVRKRLLPGLIRDAYRTARAATEKGDIIGGVQQLTRVRSMLDASKGLNAWDETLGDITVLVDGFLELNRVTAEHRPPATPGPDSTAPAPGPVADHQESKVPLSQDRRVLRMYNALDTDVTPPVTVRQDLPRIPHGLASTMRPGEKTGVLEITIDETGVVRDAVMREPVNATFDALVLEAARSWQYQPARKGGVPVRYVRRIRVSAGS
jgi:TonB family protein